MEANEVVVELVEAYEIDQGTNQVVELRCPSFHNAREKGSEENYSEDGAHMWIDLCTEDIIENARQYQWVESSLLRLVMSLRSPKSRAPLSAENGSESV